MGLFGVKKSPELEAVWELAESSGWAVLAWRDDADKKYISLQRGKGGFEKMKREADRLGWEYADSDDDETIVDFRCGYGWPDKEGRFVEELKLRDCCRMVLRPVAAISLVLGIIFLLSALILSPTRPGEIRGYAQLCFTLLLLLSGIFSVVIGSTFVLRVKSVVIDNDAITYSNVGTLWRKKSVRLTDITAVRCREIETRSAIVSILNLSLRDGGKIGIPLYSAKKARKFILDVIGKRGVSIGRSKR